MILIKVTIFQMLNSRVGFLLKRLNLANINQLTPIALYSRKSNSNHNDSFKIVGRKGTESGDGMSLTYGTF